MAINKKSKDNKYQQGCGEEEIAVGNVNWYSHCGKQYKGSSKT